MSKQLVPRQLPAQDLPYKVGEECSYWLKFGEYVQQQAIADRLLVEGKLTTAGLQAIISDRECAKKRNEIIGVIKLKAKKIKLKTRFSSKTQKAKSGFEAEVKALLAKTEIGFVHFESAGDNSRLKIKVPTEKGGTTSKAFTGSESDIRRDLGEFLDAIEENIQRKPRK